MAESYTKDAYKQIYEHPEWKKTATEFEDRFAANLYKTTYVQEAARTALSRISNMLTAYYTIRDKQQETGKKELDIQALTDVAGIIMGKQVNSGEGKSAPEVLQRRQILEENLLSKEVGAGQIGIASDTQNLEELKKQLRDAGVPNDKIEAVIDKDKSDEENVKQLAHLLNQKNIENVTYGDGNLREQMTMLFNAMVLKGGRSGEQIQQSHSMKNMLLNIDENDVEQMRMVGAIIHGQDDSGVKFGEDQLTTANIDFEDLREMENYKKKEDIVDSFSMARDLGRAVDKRKGRGTAVSRWWQGIKRGFNATMVRVFGMKRKERNEQIGLGEGHYNQLGLQLSAREAAHGRDQQGKLRWKEGQAFFKPKKEITAEGMLQTAGPSGTTLRMMGAYKLLGATKAELLHFRLALIAWMGSSRDHSLYEILVGSHNAGVTGKEDLTEAATMYQTIDPLSLDEIREQAPEGRLPHETVYQIMLQEYRKKHSNELINLMQMGNLKSAGDKALHIYTTQNYQVMNASASGGKSWGMKAARRRLQELNGGEKVSKEQVTDFYDILRVSARVSEDSLAERATHEAAVTEMESINDYDDLYYSKNPEDKKKAEERRALHTDTGRAYRGITYRGGRFDKSMASGNYTTQKLTSTSQSLLVAAKFHHDLQWLKDEDKAIFCMELDGKSAVSIDELSASKGEKEVLVPIGATFQVTRIVETAYADGITNKIYTQEEVPPEVEAMAAMNQPNVRKCRVVYLREISGPGEETRKRQNRGREKRMDYRKQLLDRKNRAAM
ncbi:MAG: hypothetical protein IKL49_11900 [Lachnospiraceae bacterium]|nr:hypothetical protein [Lachnospiraceae bacterium]